MKNRIYILLIVIIFFVLPAQAYIDPGTGSMLFSVVIGITGTLFFIFYSLFEKFKLLLFKDKTSSVKNPIVIYTESKRYYHVFNDILDEFENREFPVLVLVSDEDDAFLKKDYKYVKVENIGKGYKAYSKLAFLKADVCLMTTPGLDVYQLHRSKKVKHYSHIYHSLGDGLVYRLFGTDYFDSILTNTDKMHEYIRILEKKRNLKEKELVVVGAPYMDSMVKHLPENHRISDKTTVLLSPTWGSSAILANYGEKLLYELSKTDFYIIVRPHPQSLISEKDLIDNLVKMFKKNQNIHWDFSNDNLEAMTVSDIMITDVSGIIFEYAFLFSKPFIYSNNSFNINIYDAKDVNIETFKTKTFKTVGTELRQENIENIEELVNNLVNKQNMKEKIEQLKNEIWQKQSSGAKNVVDFLINKQKELQNNEHTL